MECTKTLSDETFYTTLGLSEGASPSDIREAFRRLVLENHPDQGGDEDRFKAIQSAYEVLSDPRKRRLYDRFGETGLEATSHSLFAQTFRDGSFARDKTVSRDLRNEVDSLRKENESLQRQLVLAQPDEENKFATSFESWLRNREPGQVRVVTSEDLMEIHGVAEESYDKKAIPKLKSFALQYTDHGEIESVVEKVPVTLPQELLWGEVLVHYLAAPLNYIDRHLARWGRVPGLESPDPLVAGSQGVALVLAVGDGVNHLRPGDMVVAAHPLVGTWRPLAIQKHSALYPFPPNDLEPEVLANFMAFVTAHRLLEDHGSLLPGDTIIQSAPESAVGQAVIQLCSLLQIKTINLLEGGERYEELSDLLHGLGATHVWKTDGSVAERLARARVPRPRLAIDGHGGEVLGKMVDCLRDDSTLVSYDAREMKPVRVPFPALIHRGIELRGFWLYRWLEERQERFAEETDILLPLLEEGRLRIENSVWEDLGKSYDAMLHDQAASVVLKFATLKEASKVLDKVEKQKKKAKSS